ncbi:hypothetical protein ACFX11_012809 [Malus domestica]
MCERKITKLSTLHQSYLTRRSNIFRGSTFLDSSSDGKLPVMLSWLLLHSICCLVSLVLGFRFSRLVFFFLFSTSTSNLYLAQFRLVTDLTIINLELPTNSVQNLEFNLNRNATTASSSSRVIFGRHGIRIQPWPHPNLTETMKAHRIIETIKREQMRQFRVSNLKMVIVVMPTYARTFQVLHLIGVLHSLMLVSYDVIWIVTKEMASIVSKSGLWIIHEGFDQRMSNTWDGCHLLEARMRLRALRIVREQKLDGIMMFADDSNMHSMELFDELQNVKWFGAVSVGILAHSENTDESSESTIQKKEEGDNMSMPIQGPACNSSNKLIGWHTFNTLPYVGKNANYIDDRAPVLPNKLEWAGFVLNSRLLWSEAEDKPKWVNNLDSIGGADELIVSPLFLLKDLSLVELLGNYGRQVLLWWLRVEARFDSKFPPSILIVQLLLKTV